MLERDLGDQEKAYILFYKYVECVQRIQKHHEYKKDEKYYVSMFNLKKNMRLGIENLETLTTALERRYEEKEAEAVAEKLSKVDISRSNTVQISKLSNLNLAGGSLERRSDCYRREVKSKIRRQQDHFNPQVK